MEEGFRLLPGQLGHVLQAVAAFSGFFLQLFRNGAGLFLQFLRLLLSLLPKAFGLFPQLLCCGAGFFLQLLRLLLCLFPQIFSLVPKLLGGGSRLVRGELRGGLGICAGFPGEGFDLFRHVHHQHGTGGLLRAPDSFILVGVIVGIHHHAAVLRLAQADALAIRHHDPQIVGLRIVRPALQHQGGPGGGSGGQNAAHDPQAFQYLKRSEHI